VILLLQMPVILLFQMQVPTDSSGHDVTGNSFLLFATVLFTVGVLFYIFKPAPTERAEEKTRLAYLYERKEQTFENLRDLNFEYKAGKLSDADFSSMRDSMEQEAANLLAEIEELEHESGNRQEITA
jgi:cbb3-type cytochrome oxidase subunit 3